jgi:hypothetical protein
MTIVREAVPAPRTPAQAITLGPDPVMPDVAVVTLAELIAWRKDGLAQVVCATLSDFEEPLHTEGCPGHALADLHLWSDRMLLILGAPGNRGVYRAIPGPHGPITRLERVA